MALRLPPNKTAFRLYGTHTFVSHMKELREALGSNLARAMRAVVPMIQRDIKAITPVDTGRLKKSVTVRYVQGSNPRIEVKTVGYGVFVERGTSKMAAQPFVEPVLKGNANRWLVRVMDEVARLKDRR
jgi:HK97 gp10 family phage protein